MKRMTTRQAIAELAVDVITTFLAVAVLLAIAVGSLSELLLAMPVPFWQYAWAGLIVVGSSVLVVALSPTRRRIELTSAGCLSVMVVVAILHLVPWSSRKPFLQDLERVQPGMARAEVEQIMAGYMRGTGWPEVPFADGAGPRTLTSVSTGATYQTKTDPNGQLAIKDSIVFRHSNDGRLNSDWGVVTFRNGKVIAKQFMPD